MVISTTESNRFVCCEKFVKESFKNMFVALTHLLTSKFASINEKLSFLNFRNVFSES